MDQSLIEKYKSEMLNMYRSVRANTVPQDEEMHQAVQNEETNQAPQDEETNQAPQNPTPVPLADDSTGRLIAIVTAFREIYPVANAKVTVFTGNLEDMQVVDTAYTDRSGRTPPFILNTPPKSLSLDSENKQTPYATYNMMVSAEGYLDNIHINIPLFSGVTSLQSSNMMLLETAGEDKGPQIFDESQRFDL